MSYIGNNPVNGTFQKLDSISGGFNGSATTFNLTVSAVAVTPGTSRNLIVSRSGVLQEPDTDYSVTGSNIIFSPAPTSGESCFIVRLGDVGTLITVADASVTLTKVDSTVLSATNHAVTPVGNIATTNVQAALAELDTKKQVALVSGTSIKTVNGTSVLGSGDITITASLTVTIVSTATQSAVASTHYVLTNISATTVTFPVSATSGDTIWVTVTNSLDTNIVARNGLTIMGLAEDMTLNGGLNQTYQFRYVNTSWRLV